MAAEVGITFGRWHETKPIMAVRRATQTISNPTTTQASNAGTKADNVVEVSVTTGAAWVTVEGSSTAAVVGTGYFLPDGTTRHFAAGFGTVVNVINDS